MSRVAVAVTDIEPAKATLTTSLTGDDNDLKFTAKRGGPWGNNIQVAYIDPAGNDESLEVVVEGFLITVNLATDGSSVITSTANDVMAKIFQTPDAFALVDVELASSNDGTGLVTALSATALAGGTFQTALPAATNGDATNDHYFTGNDGTVVLKVINSNVAAKTVTIHYGPNAKPGVEIDPLVEPIPGSSTRELGPFPSDEFNQNADGDVYFDPELSGDLDFQAYRNVRAL